MKLRSWILLSIAALGWGVGGVITRAAFDQGVDPVEFSAYRSGTAVVAVVGYLLARRQWTLRLPWRDGLVLGSTNLAAPFLLLTLAVVYASAGFVGLLVANVPVSTALWAHAQGSELLTRAKVIGLSISSAGVLVLLASGDSGIATGGNAALAIGLSLAGIAAAGYGIIHAKKVASAFEPAQLALPQLVVGTLLLAIPIPFTDGLPTDFTAAGWSLVIAAGVFSTALPFIVFYEAMQEVSATQAALTGYMIPLVAIVLGAVLLDEQVTSSIIGGGALILAGVVLVDRAASPSQSETTTAE